MSLRTRLLAAVAGITCVTVGGAFVAVFVAVGHWQERRLDTELAAMAREEAAALSGKPPGAALLTNRPGGLVTGFGRLVKLGVVYGPDGTVLDATEGLMGPPPPRSSLREVQGRCFDTFVGGEHLRAILLAVDGHPGTELLVASPHTDLDDDEAFLARVMWIAFGVAVLWSLCVTQGVVSGLTREHRRIAETARSVAGGNLGARVATRSRDPEIAQLGHDIDQMIARLEILVDSQQRFVAHAAHELRRPLTMLLGELSLALRRPRDSEGYRQTIEQALDATRALNALSDQLLTLARLGAERERCRSPVSLHEALQSALAQVRDAAHAANVRIDIEVGDMVMAGHANDIARLFRNLLENAIRHSPRGGRVLVDTALSANQRVVRVADEGCGVPAERREKIFEPFFRGELCESSPDSGTGLGLSIVRQIARAHGGEVFVDPAPRVGARFVVVLPHASEVCSDA